MPVSTLLMALFLAACQAQASDLLQEGVDLLRAKKAVEAEKVLESCVSADPSHTACWWQLGWARWVQRDWDGTLQAWQEVQKRDPSWPGLASNLPVVEDNVRIARIRKSVMESPPTPRSSTAPAGTTLRVRAVGDIMLGTTFPDGYLPPDDGASSLASVTSWLQDADLTFGNLEGPLCDTGTSDKCKPDAPAGSCYAFRQPTRYGSLLKAAGIDMLTTANNHSGDFGRECRMATEATLDNLGLGHTGRPGDVATSQVKGLSVALIGFHASEATHDVRDPETAALLVRDLASRHDIVIVTFHGGAEGPSAIHVPEGSETYYGENRGNLRVFSRAVVDAGADLVVGHGPHVLRGMEIYKDRLVAYSLGNFATYGRFSVKGPAGVGAVLEARLGPDGRFQGGRILPTRQVGEGIPEPDPLGQAISSIRTLSVEDFPETGVRVDQDGTLTAP